MTNSYVKENGSRILAADSNGIYQSLDKGKSWEPLKLDIYLKKYEGKSIDKYTLHIAILLDIQNDLDS